jgi:hypothetical protein
MLQQPHSHLPLSHNASNFLGTVLELRVKIPQMARGWESKSIEQQQEEMAQQRETPRAPIPSAQQKRNREREGLVLSRERLAQQLQTATKPRHREMLEQALAEIDRQLAAFKEVK